MTTMDIDIRQIFWYDSIIDGQLTGVLPICSILVERKHAGSTTWNLLLNGEYHETFEDIADSDIKKLVQDYMKDYILPCIHVPAIRPVVWEEDADNLEKRRYIGTHTLGEFVVSEVLHSKYSPYLALSFNGRHVICCDDLDECKIEAAEYIRTLLYHSFEG